MVNSDKANKSIHVKSLIAEIKSRYGYFVTYKKAWMEKENALVMDSTTETNPIIIFQESVPRTIVEYVTRSFIIDGVQDNLCYIFERVFWAFKPCIDDFNYYKPIVQVDGAFLTGKYHRTLLTAISQDGYEMKQLTLQLKLSTLRSQFQQAFAWIDQIPLKKWTQAYDEGRRYDHMTTNLAECMNFVLKGARSLSICALVKTTFEITKSWFVE
uniref:MULE transposase domain-containing protein n=1 Tax=Phaseolus vulgaris TaxID=3885 RepID=V7B495_PHAVU|nr:hypothetical protein PHAVU_008G135800g [Phaseolus vulgaris]ESW12712.1 hypothetical protein PHAVU_008G135800g [Phaseolus vulgaris]